MIVSSRHAKKSVAEKGFKEGKNLQLANHVRSVEYNNISDCIKYCFIRGEVVPQTRISESPYKVWICMHTEVCEILTGKCGCVAGYSESCKHVFVHYYILLSTKCLLVSIKHVHRKGKFGMQRKKGEKIHPQGGL